MNRFDGKVGIVTGASRGIGLAIAQRLVAEGARVVITARKPEALAEAAASMGGEGRCVAVAGNAGDPAHQDEAIRTAIERFGSLDLLVNNTGINPAYGPLMHIDLDVARKILDTNVVAVLSWVQKAYAAWMGEHGGAVVNVGSVAGLRAAPGIAFYGASKAALLHLTEELAVELGPGIRVNAVAPAVVKTDFAKALYEGREDKASRGYAMKRLGEPEDIAGAVAYLLSDDAAWTTGHTIVLDGGATLIDGSAIGG
ncbi:SDR family oxidoreductase [Arsenicicoccus sp. oral taxon 190]|uniref:SDR family oxidoreductase n=1 Tax=Arsenicicoccus sp. oral taxon 190 TaxID=1658671 RepID=UPI00067A32D5|nr:SDR family oxidoreductase [Arsenicicoccus sp. oral taxon 190]AKT51044.1 3-ketoacyl-ACP reductase [Arsenicicoccus sp. oral taxon 190]